MGQRRAHWRSGHFRNGTWIPGTWVRAHSFSGAGGGHGGRGGRGGGDGGEWFELCLMLVALYLTALVAIPISYMYKRFGIGIVALFLLVLFLCFYYIPWPVLAPFVYAYMLAAPLAMLRTGLLFLLCFVCFILYVLYESGADVGLVFAGGLGIFLLIYLYRVMNKIADCALGIYLWTAVLLFYLGYSVPVIIITDFIIGTFCLYFIALALNEPLSDSDVDSDTVSDGTAHGVAPRTQIVAHAPTGPEYDVDCRDSHGRTPLHRVSDVQRAEQFISAGADINARDNYGKTPLHCARTVDIARVLIRHGADTEILDNYGKSPMENSNVSIACSRDLKDADDD